MDLDDILPEIGEFGAYQKMMLWFVLLPAVLPCGFHAYNQIFMAAKPAHWCLVPQLMARNLTAEMIKNISIPKYEESEKYQECSMYNKSYTSLVSNDTADIISCPYGWEYDRSDYPVTVVTEWNIVCEKDYFSMLGLVLLGVGGLIGNYIFGYVQDSLGRRPAFFIYLLIESIFGIGTAFAPTFTWWLIFRFGVGFTVPAILGTPYVLAIELVGPTKRTTCTILINIAYSLGLVALSIVVYLIRDWRQLALATSVPFSLFFLYWWVLPESPRWLLARGRYKEADKILRTMARVNGKKLPANYMTMLKKKYQVDNRLEGKQMEEEKKKRYGIWDLFRYPNLRRKTLIITFIWFTNTAVYVGLSYYAPALGGDEFLNFFLAGAVELPTYMFLWPAMDFWGRRWTLCLSMIIGGVACLATFLVQNDSSVTLILYCVGKMGISSSFVVLPLMASELYPTVVRGLGMSFSSVAGQIGPVVIPIVNYFGEEWIVLPLVIMGSLLVAGGVCSLFLPETLRQHLPQSLEDGEVFGRDLGWKDCVTCCPPRVAPTSSQRPSIEADSTMKSLIFQNETKRRSDATFEAEDTLEDATM